MKVALCLSGLARFVEEGYPSIYNTFIRPYETDVYIHTWKTDPTILLYHYRPKKFTIDTQHNPMTNYEQLPYAWGHQPIYNMFSMYESIYKCHALIDEPYDIVIRCRFDLNFKTSIDLQTYDLSYIHTQYESHYKYNDVHDQFAFSSQKNMTTYARCYNHILSTYHSMSDVPIHLRLSPEIILGRYLTIPVQTHNFNFNIIRTKA